MVVFLQKLRTVRTAFGEDQDPTNLFKQPSWAHLYGRFPVCMRRWRARLEDWANISHTRFVPFDFTYVREPLSTADMRTLMGLLSGVSPNVNCQGTSLNKALSTPRCHTRVGSLIRMDSIVTLKIRLPVKALHEVLAGTIFSSFPSLTLLHVCQSHWKGRALGSLSTNSMTSILYFLCPSFDFSQKPLVIWLARGLYHKSLSFVRVAGSY